MDRRRWERRGCAGAADVRGYGDGRYSALNHKPHRCERMRKLTPKETALAERGYDEAPPTRPCKGGQYRLPKLDAPSRKVLECEVGAPEGNLVIVERCDHKNQQHFPDWEYGWVGTGHVLTSTQDGTLEQREKEKKLSI